jgi:hypothetical protein
MIVDKRIYTLKPGSVPTYMKIYEEYGLKVQLKHLGKPVGWFFAEVGALNRITHIWAFDDVADRAKKRAAMSADPDWATYRAKMAEADLRIAQENEILVAAPWSPDPRN